jgi:DNA-binding MarR family transcriptional regulator
VAKKKQAPKTKQDLTCEPLKYDNPSITHEALKHYLGYLLHKATIMYKSGAYEKLAVLNLQGFHTAALAIIEADPNVNQIQICSETGVDKATMVKTIDHLQKMGLVERKESQNDRRVKTLSITKKGKAVLTQAVKIRIGCENDFLSVLSAKESELFRATLLKLVQRG